MAGLTRKAPLKQGKPLKRGKALKPKQIKRKASRTFGRMSRFPPPANCPRCKWAGMHAGHGSVRVVVATVLPLPEVGMQSKEAQDDVQDMLRDVVQGGDGSDVRPDASMEEAYLVDVDQLAKCPNCQYEWVHPTISNMARTAAYQRHCERVLERDGWECQRCHTQGVPLQVAHKEGFSRARNPGPEKNAMRNLEACCMPCHDEEHLGHASAPDATDALDMPEMCFPAD